MRKIEALHSYVKRFLSLFQNGTILFLLCLSLTTKAQIACYQVLNKKEYPLEKTTPSGELTLLKKSGRSQPGGLYKDEKGVEWYLKKDIHYPELQTSAEVISSEIYRHFGYRTPETHIVKVEGVRYSASLYYHGGADFNFKTDLPDTTPFRGMRIVAAFLKDWDRVVRGNNILLPDGNLLLLDFGGSLGARAQGDHKPGVVFSQALGSFSAPEQSIPHLMKELFGSYDVSSLPANHPWQRMNLADAQPIIELFRSLDSQKIESIVDKARFSSNKDRYQMIDSLAIRRDAFLEYLEGFLGGKIFRSDSYWASKSPIEDLSFTVRENRDPRIGHDIQQYVKKLEIHSHEMIFFRGQAQFTKNIYSPGYQEQSHQSPLPQSKKEQSEILNSYLHLAHRDLNPLRQEQRKYRFIGAGGDIPFWDKATPFDLLAERHSTSNGLPIFVSVSRRLDVASRWVENSRFPTRYRYVYIMVVPQKVALPISRVLQQKKSKSNDEAEWVIPFDATPYVRGVYDTVENRFISF